MAAALQTQSRIDLKIIILGNGGVGKTSFIYRYINNDFTDTISTIGASFVLKKWRSFYFGIWDTAGQERFARISSYYSRGAQAAIVAYDITDSSTFDNLPTYIEFLASADKSCYLVLIGTKLDLVQENPERRQVSREDGAAFAERHNAAFYETSAKNSINITNVFDTIGYHCLAARLSGSEPSQPAPRTSQPASEPLVRPCCSIQ